MSFFKKKSSTPEEQTPQKKGWLQRLKAGLHQTSDKLTQGIQGIFKGRKLDHEALEELEDLLISADMGVETSQDLVRTLKKQRFEKEVTDLEVRQLLATSIYEKLKPFEGTWPFQTPHHPHVMLMVGINGSGKTTTLGKLAAEWQQQGLKVCLAAGDTFRAAAIDQLAIWAERAGVPLFRADHHKDPAGLAHEAYVYSQAQGHDLLLIDTAGRLHTNTDLMAELSKITRVLKKLDENAPHSAFLVIDATLGQNIHQQVRIFREAIPLTGLIVTKLDGTAKGGALVSVVEKTSLPIMAIGVGESIEDLKPFNAKEFAYNLLDIDPNHIVTSQESHK